MSSPETTIIINTITRNKTKWVDWKKCVIRGGEGALEAHNILWEEWKGECIDIKMRNREIKPREKTSENEGGKKGMRMKCGFFRTETFRHSQSIWTNPPILVCDGMEQRERGNVVQKLSPMKRDKRTCS